MIVYSAFKGDGNEELKTAQHEMYNFLLYKIFEGSKITFLLCDEVCNKLTEQERSKLIEQNSFDHRTLQGAHDLIAIAFRYTHRGGALTLFEPAPEKIINYFNSKYINWNRGILSDMALVWAYHWEQFFNTNVERITGIKTMLPKFVSNVINASVFNPNNKNGTESEHQLKIVLSEYFQITNIISN
jgi:hypothetical protein